MINILFLLQCTNLVKKNYNRLICENLVKLNKINRKLLKILTSNKYQT